MQLKLRISTMKNFKYYKKYLPFFPQIDHHILLDKPARKTSILNI